MVSEECKQIEHLRQVTLRIEKPDMAKINAVKQNQHKEKYILVMAVDRFIIIRNVQLFGKNALIVAQKLISIRTTESQKIKKEQK